MKTGIISCLNKVATYFFYIIISLIIYKVYLFKTHITEIISVNILCFFIKNTPEHVHKS